MNLDQMATIAKNTTEVKEILDRITNKLDEIKEVSGLDWMEYEGSESFMYAFMETLSTETLQDIANGLLPALNDKMEYRARIVLKYRQ